MLPKDITSEVTCWV